MSVETAIKLTECLVLHEAITPEYIQFIWSGNPGGIAAEEINKEYFNFEERYGNTKRKFKTSIFGFIMAKGYFGDVSVWECIKILKDSGVDPLKTFKYDDKSISEYLLYLAGGDDIRIPAGIYRLIASDNNEQLKMNIDFLEKIKDDFENLFPLSLISFMEFIIEQNESKNHQGEKNRAENSEDESEKNDKKTNQVISVLHTLRALSRTYLLYILHLRAMRTMRVLFRL